MARADVDGLIHFAGGNQQWIMFVSKVYRGDQHLKDVEDTYI